MAQRTVIHRYAETAKFFPERTALFTDGRHYRYRELTALAQGIRNGLIESGFVGAARIGILSGTDACSYASVLAVLAQGAAYVPLYDRNSREHNARIIEDAALDLVLVSGALEAAGRVEAALPGDIEVMCTRAADSDSRLSAGLDVAEIPVETLASIIYSFDGAGRPVGVPMYHRNLNSFFAALREPGVCDYGHDDRFLQAFGLHDERSVAPLFAAFSVGACCYVVADVPVEDVLAEQNITVAMMPPATTGRTDLPCLRHSLLFGPVVPARFIRQWTEQAPNATIQTVYGRAETTVFCLRRTWRKGDSPPFENAFMIGTPLPGVEAVVLDADDRQAPVGQAGMLYLHGAQVSGHYWNAPSRTAEAFVHLADDGVHATAWRSGDVCSMDDRGEFVFHGRSGEQRDAAVSICHDL